MKSIFLSLFFSTLLSTLIAQDAPIFPKGEKSPNVHHTGTVWLKELNAPDSIFNFSASVATFDTSARLNWHIHPAGQILFITQGFGFYQEKNKPKQVVRKGEVIKCLPGVPHWHGATPESGFAYLATTPAQKGKTIWLEKVTDEEYFGGNKLFMDNKSAEQEIINLSKTKWTWMAARDTDALNALFNEKAVFVHMGGTMNKAQEIGIIKDGRIQYKHAEIQKVSVEMMGNTAILLNTIRLTAIVGGNEVVNPFVVTEVYVKQNDTWTLGSMSFTKLLTP